MKIGGLVHEDVGICWLAIRAVPFGLCYCILAAELLYHHFILEHDILRENAQISKVFSTLKAEAIVCYFSAYVWAIKFFGKL
jgi:hypothetical protein